MKILNVINFEGFKQLYQDFLTTNDQSQNLLLLFVASDDLASKESWCSDCRNSKPIIDRAIEGFQSNERIVLATIQVGQRDQWKAADNPFRMHELQIKAVPTLINLRTGNRLVEAECADFVKVSQLFSSN